MTLRNAPSLLHSAKHELPDLSNGITSFAGPIIDDTFYAYGGNYGSAHEYNNEGQSNDLWTLNLASGSEWKDVSTGQTNVCSPATDSWSKAPSLLGGGAGMDGFGTSAFACTENLYVSTISGSLQRLTADNSKWNSLFK